MEYSENGQTAWQLNIIPVPTKKRVEIGEIVLIIHP